MAIKQVKWAELMVQTSELAEHLTVLNFQPGKFHLLPGYRPEVTLIIYVESEK